MKIPFPHIHKWRPLLQQDKSQVRVCRCGELQSFLYDYQAHDYRWVKGCYYPTNMPIYIVAEDHDAFKEACLRMKGIGFHVEWLQPPFPTDDGLQLFFMREWWRNEDYHTEAFNRLINRRNPL